MMVKLLQHCCKAASRDMYSSFFFHARGAGDRVARAGKDPSTGVAGKDSLKNAKMEEESILGQAGGRRLVWASLLLLSDIRYEC